MRQLLAIRRQCGNTCRIARLRRIGNTKCGLSFRLSNMVIFVGPIWVPFGAHLGSHLGPIWVPFGIHFGPNCDPLETPFGAHLGPIWGFANLVDPPHCPDSPVCQITARQIAPDWDKSPDCQIAFAVLAPHYLPLASLSQHPTCRSADFRLPIWVDPSWDRIMDRMWIEQWTSFGLICGPYLHSLHF